MKDLINRSYEAIKGRGLIDDETYESDFLVKMEEEMWEAQRERHNTNKYIEEVTDLATVCIMQIHHLGYDFIKEFKKVVIKNEKRAKERNASAK